MNTAILVGAIIWALLSISIIIWLLIANSKREKQIKTLLRDRKRLTFEVVSYQKEHIQRKWVKHVKSLQIGYCIQYFVDSIPFVVSEPTIITTLKEEEINPEALERAVKFALEEGRKTLKQMARDILPILPEDDKDDENT